MENLPSRVDLTRIPKWVTEPRYDGVEVDIKEWFTRYFFWKRWNGKEETLNTDKLLARALAEAKYESLKQTNALKNSTERSAILQAYDAHKHGWYKMVGEIEDVKELLEEMLKDAIDSGQKGGSKYDLVFIIEKLIPALESMNVPAEFIFSIPDNISKAKLMVPAARQILKGDDPEVAKEQIIELIEDIPNQDVTWKDYSDKIATFMGREKKEINMVCAEVFLIPDKEIVVIESDRAHTLAIETALKGIAEGFDFRDSITLMKKLNSMLLPRDSGYSRMIFKNNQLVPASEDSKVGILLPNPQQFKELAIQATVANRHSIHQILKYAPVAICVNVLKPFTENFEKDSAKLFNLPVTDDLIERIRYAISNYYQLPSDIEALFPAKIEISYSNFFMTKEIGLSLIFTPLSSEAIDGEQIFSYNYA